MVKKKKVQSTKKTLSFSDKKVKGYIIGIIVLAVVLSVAIGYSASSSSKSQSSTTPPAKAQVTAKTNNQATQQPVDTKALAETKQVAINTDKGDIVLEVYPKAMPITVANFEKLIKANFYNGLKFHRVEDWVVQGGDPKGNGTGGPGWSIKLETNPALKNLRGMVAMARSSDPNSAGSQFYILKKDATSLDGQYAVFGKVIKGMDVVDKLKAGDKMNKVTIK